MASVKVSAAKESKQKFPPFEKVKLPPAQQKKMQDMKAAYDKAAALMDNNNENRQTKYVEKPHEKKSKEQKEAHVEGMKKKFESAEKEFEEIKEKAWKFYNEATQDVIEMSDTEVREPSPKQPRLGRWQNIKF